MMDAEDESIRLQLHLWAGWPGSGRRPRFESEQEPRYMGAEFVRGWRRERTADARVVRRERAHAARIDAINREMQSIDMVKCGACKGVGRDDRVRCGACRATGLTHSDPREASRYYALLSQRYGR